MKIAVCVKQVVTREWPLRIDEARTWVQDRDAGRAALRGEPRNG